MKKIPTLFVRPLVDGRLSALVSDALVPGTEWVTRGLGVATVKHDGTAILVHSDGLVYKRYDLKPGRTAPAGFMPAQERDPVTGHHPGWVPAREDDPANQWLYEALAHYRPSPVTLLGCWPISGTYELVGPKVQGNPYHLTRHQLIAHRRDPLPDFPRTFAAIRDYFAAAYAARTGQIEGVVWWHDKARLDDTCDKVKIKARDFDPAYWPPRHPADRSCDLP